MRVLHLLNLSLPYLSGYSTRCANIANSQQKIGIETVLLTSCKHNLYTTPIKASEKINNLLYHRCFIQNKFLNALLKTPLLGQILCIFLTYFKLRQLVLTTKPDLLHAHSPALNGVAAIFAGKRFKIPVIYEIRAFWEDAAVANGACAEDGIRYKLSQLLENYVLKNASAIVTIAVGLKQEIMARQIKTGPIRIIPNALRHSTIASPPLTLKKIPKLQQHYSISNNDFMLGYIGSLFNYEGIEILIEIIPELLQEIKSLKLLLVGNGPEEKRLRSQVAKLQLSKTVIFAGATNPNEIGSFYALVDLLVYPRHSIRLTERVTPLKPFEALTYGVPFILSDVGGHREIINGLTADHFLFRPGCKQDLKNKIVALINNPDQKQQLTQQQHKIAVQQNTWEETAISYKELYSKFFNPTVKTEYYRA